MTLRAVSWGIAAAAALVAGSVALRWFARSPRSSRLLERQAWGEGRERGETLAPLERRVYEVDGAQIWTRYASPRVPEGPPVVLVHGLAVSSLYMIPTARRLATTFAVHAPDMPGYGDSPPVPALARRGAATTVEAMAEWLARFIEEAGLAPAALLANSMGCQVAVRLAATRPELVDRLVLQGPTMDAYARSAPRIMGRFALASLREPPTLHPIVIRDYLRCGPSCMWRAFMSGLDEPLEEDLPRVQAPALVLHGARDPICSPAWTREVARLLPRGQHVLLPDAAHAAIFHAAREVADVVRAFLRA